MKQAFNHLSLKHKIGVITAGLVIAFFAIRQCMTVVQPGYRGISVTLGTVNPTFHGEGFTLKLPFLEHIVQYPVKQITVGGQANCFSSDLQTVNVDFKTLYRIPENRVVELFQKYQGDPYTSLVEPRIQEALKEVSARYRAEDLVKNREQFKNNVLSIVKVDLQNLIIVSDLTIHNIRLSEDLEHAIEQKQIKEQEALAKRYELDKARKDAEITLVNAEAEARSVKIKGEALSRSPQVIELEIAKKWNGEVPQTVVVGKGGGNVLLPLR